MIIGFIFCLIGALLIGFWLGHYVGTKDTTELYEERIKRFERERETLNKKRVGLDRITLDK